MKKIALLTFICSASAIRFPAYENEDADNLDHQINNLVEQDKKILADIAVKADQANRNAK